MDISNPLDPSDVVTLNVSPAIAQQVEREDVASPELMPRVPGELVVHTVLEAERLGGESGRRIATALLGGQSRTMAALAGGLTEGGLRDWCKKVPDARKVFDMCEQIGLASTLETELYRRAMSGKDDKGSLRALELILKARRPEYREKSQLALEVVHRAETAMQSLTEGWQQSGTYDEGSSSV